jgi:hypothetical protein
MPPTELGPESFAKVQPIEEAIEALKRLPVTSGKADEHDPTSLQAYAAVSELSGGSFYVPFIDSYVVNPTNETLIDPTADTKSAKVFEASKAQLLNENLFYKFALKRTSRWWETSATSLQKVDVEHTLREVWRTIIHMDNETTEGIDILNCSPEVLSDDEHEAFSDTLHKISNLTEGKIHSRIKGIILCGDGVLDDKSVGEFNHSTGVMLINISEARRFKGVMPPRYAPFFAPGDALLPLKILTAHELGHAMDIKTIEEAEAHILDVNPHRRGYRTMAPNGIIGASSFDVLPGWTAAIAKGDYGDTNQWHFNVTEATEFGEAPPTEYAYEEPREDNAESFAIIALGGNTSSMKIRHKLVLQTMELAEGKKLQPHKVDLQHIVGAGETYVPRSHIGRICLQAYLNPPLRRDKNGWPILS